MRERDDDHLLDPQQRDADERPCTQEEHDDVKADEVAWARCLRHRPWHDAGLVLAECPRCGSTLAIEVPDDDA